ncbi:MAG: hypothetical protein ACI9MR_001246, partial [Myxococcota bacterium]
PAAPNARCTQPQAHVDNADDTQPACGTNDNDACGTCAGPGPQLLYADVDGDGAGDPLTPTAGCGSPDGFVTNADDPEPNCATDDTDVCGACAGGGADLDCEGTCFGAAFSDSCARCVGGTTGLVAATGDLDEDGTPDLCDLDCVGADRFIVQWTDLPRFVQNGGAGAGGAYTFQLVMFSTGEFHIQYAPFSDYNASATVGVQGAGGASAIEFGYNTDFAVGQPTVTLVRDGAERFVADYSKPLYWLDIRDRGTALELGDDGLAQLEIGFAFPFLAGSFEQLTVAANGFVAFTEPFGTYQNRPLPRATIGAMIAPLWDDFNPLQGGTLHYFHAAPTCGVDCNEVVGGFATQGGCGTCLTGIEGGDGTDCAGVCGGTAAIDGCSRCAGGTTDVVPADLDCAGVCAGEAVLDECRLCTGGTTSVVPTPGDECPNGVDLIVDRDELVGSVAIDYVEVAEDDCLIREGCVQGPGNRKVIRFSTMIANVGNKDLELGNPNDGGANWHYDECHGHFHYEAYAGYQLFDVAEDRLLEIGSKNGFCVMDTGVYDTAITTACVGYNCGSQGITAGCQDTYHSGLQCQWVDVTGLPDGEYEVIVTTNPEGEIEELDKNNNSARVRVQMTGDTVQAIQQTQ